MIESMSPRSGRVLKEDGSVVNIADMLEQITASLGGASCSDPRVIDYIGEDVLNEFEFLKPFRDSNCIFLYDANRDNIVNGTYIEPINNIKIDFMRYDETSKKELANGKKCRYFGGEETRMKGAAKVENNPILNLFEPPIAVFSTFRMLTKAFGYMIIKHISTSADIQYGLCYSTSLNKFAAGLDGVFNIAPADEDIKTDTWYNAGFIWDGQEIQPYVNFKKSGDAVSHVANTIVTGANMYIGSRNHGGSGKFQGDIASITIYKSDDVESILSNERKLAAGYVGGV